MGTLITSYMRGKNAATGATSPTTVKEYFERIATAEANGAKVTVDGLRATAIYPNGTIASHVYKPDKGEDITPPKRKGRRPVEDKKMELRIYPRKSAVEACGGKEKAQLVALDAVEGKNMKIKGVKAAVSEPLPKEMRFANKEWPEVNEIYWRPAPSTEDEKKLFESAWAEKINGDYSKEQAMEDSEFLKYRYWTESNM